ncbi:MAG: pyridoxal phosphate-dependent aminotransferase [Actinobacteria bacterium]|nr:pyridoxal phosphate-dependent aminotransferase [Actinomycetota bacterium]
MATKRVKKLPSFIVMDILEEANRLEKEGVEVIHLEIGEPDFDTPDFVKEAAISAIRQNITHYTDTQGLTELRDSISEYFLIKYGVSVKPQNIIVTLGTSPALFMALSGLIEKGDEVIITDPGYACYKNVIEFVGGVPVTIPVYDDEGYAIDTERLKKSITKRTKAIIINSPANPTGSVLSKENLKEIAVLTEKHGITVISDEIYHGLNYEGKDHSFLEFNEKCIVINGFSKLFAMTGWRLGYIIIPDELLQPLKRVHQNLFICAAGFTQVAAVKALKEGEEFVQEVVAEYKRRRDYLVPELRRIGFDIKTFPKGAFYVMAGIKNFQLDSLSFSKLLLRKAGVAVTPGIDFGANGEGYVRFSFANSIENLKRAVQKIENFLNEGGTK